MFYCLRSNSYKYSTIIPLQLFLPQNSWFPSHVYQSFSCGIEFFCHKIHGFPLLYTSPSAVALNFSATKFMVSLSCIPILQLWHWIFLPQNSWFPPPVYQSFSYGRSASTHILYSTLHLTYLYVSHVFQGTSNLICSDE